MMKEKIYVVVPVYNVEQYLERCVESILNQTYDNYEIILVDDGSTDKSPVICDRYAEQYKNITVIHQENGGLSAARNAGIKYAQSVSINKEWITFIDSDDYIHSYFLEYLYKVATESKCNISVCLYKKTTESDENTVIQIDDLKCEVLTPEGIWVKDRTIALIVVNKLYRLDCFNDICFPVGKIHEDEFTTYKILFKESKIATIWQPLYFYYFNPNSITHTEWHPKRLAGLDAFDEQMVFFKKNGYMVAYEQSLSALCYHSMMAVKYIKVLSPKYDYLKKNVKKKRNNALKKYRKECGFKKKNKLWYEVTIKKPMQKAMNDESFFTFVKRQIKRKLLHK